MDTREKFNLKYFFFAFGLLIAFGFFAVANFSIFKKANSLSEALQIFQERTAKIATEKEILEGKISQATSSFYLEKTARDELNYKKPGEQVVAFPIVDNSTSSIKMELESKDFWHWILTKIK
ncbi:MAG: septum formation initiator family protein [bacterium]|nr:septum formation initiator family protein [bacterium]